MPPALPPGFRIVTPPDELPPGFVVIPTPRSPAPVAPSGAGAQEQTAPAEPPAPTPAQALVQRYGKHYEGLSDQALDEEERRIGRDDPTSMNMLTSFRLEALRRVRQQRQGPGGPVDQVPPHGGRSGSATPPGLPGTPAPPDRGPGQAPRQPRSERQPQGLEEHTRWVEHYRALSPRDLQAEARRVLLSDPLTRKADTNNQLTALNQLLDERKAVKPHGELVNEEALARYQDEVQSWSTTKLLEESHTLRGALGSTLSILTQLKPETWAAAGKAARWAREAAAMGGAVASYPGAVAGLPFLAPLALGLSLKGLATAFPAAGAHLKDLYHRQLAIGLELHKRQSAPRAPAAPGLEEED